MIDGSLKVWSFRIRLPSGRAGRVGLIADTYTSARELSEHLYPGRVLTMPSLERTTGSEDPNKDGENS